MGQALKGIYNADSKITPLHRARATTLNHYWRDQIQRRLSRRHI
jgi:hypothetical protein